MLSRFNCALSSISHILHLTNRSSSTYLYKVVLCDRCRLDCATIPSLHVHTNQYIDRLIRNKRCLSWYSSSWLESPMLHRRESRLVLNHGDTRLKWTKEEMFERNLEMKMALLMEVICIGWITQPKRYNRLNTFIFILLIHYYYYSYNTGSIQITWNLTYHLMFWI